MASRSEKKVNQRLQELGLESYVPLKTEKKQWSDRIKTVVSPLISGYVFAKVNDATREEVFKVNGVINYVRYNGGDAVVREQEIVALKSIEEKGYYIEGSFSEEWKTGDKVLIQYGPFKGLYGAIQSEAHEDVFKIAIEDIGYILTIKVPKEVLVKHKS